MTDIDRLFREIGDDARGAWARLPMNRRPELYAYIVHGTRPGAFLRAVLADQLVRSFATASAEDLAAMHHYTRFLANHMPLAAWGSVEAINDWERME